MKKAIIVIVVILVIGIGAYAYSREVAKAPTQTQVSQNTPSSTPTPTAAGAPSATPKATPTPTTHFSSGEEGGTDGSGIQVYEVDFTDTGFAPASSNLNVGDYVFFKNKATANFVPVDAAYAGFNTGQTVAPGKEYKFQFNQAGTWTIKNQLNPSQTATVIVK